MHPIDSDSLQRIAAAAGDPSLFPPQVVALFAQGRRSEAHQAMSLAMLNEIDPVRRRRMKALLRHRTLWGGKSSSGSLILPMVALGAVLIATLVGAGVLFTSASDVHVVNGFSDVVTVQLGETVLQMAPNSREVLKRVRNGETSVTASFSDGELIEELQIEIRSGFGKTRIYNVAGRAGLWRGFILYGDGEPPDGKMLPALSYQETRSDNPFEEAPEEKYLAEHETDIEDQIDFLSDFSAVEIADIFLDEGELEDAIRVCEAGLKEWPEYLGLHTILMDNLPEDGEETPLSYLEAVLERQPESVDLHSLYQDTWPGEELESLEPRYREMAAAQPESATRQYLAARVITDSGERLAYFKRAIAADPTLTIAHQGLAEEYEYSGRWSEAAEAYKGYALAWQGDGEFALRKGLRILIRQGKSVQQQAEWLPPAKEESGYLESLVSAQVRAAARPADAQKQYAIFAKEQGVGGNDVDYVWGVGRIAIAAGDLGTARKMLDMGLGDGEGVDVRLALLLALSDGATEGDKKRAERAVADTDHGSLSLEDALYSILLFAADDPELKESLMDAQLQSDMAPLRGLLRSPPKRAAEVDVQALGYSDYMSVVVGYVLGEMMGSAGKPLVREARADAVVDELPFRE